LCIGRGAHVFTISYNFYVHTHFTTYRIPYFICCDVDNKQTICAPPTVSTRMPLKRRRCTRHLTTFTSTRISHNLIFLISFHSIVSNNRQPARRRPSVHGCC
jgi:hypothetical protein